MLKYIVGIIMIGIGVILVIKTEWFFSFFGRVAWAERYLGMEGGSRVFYKLLGVVLILLSFLIMNGRIIGVLDWVFRFNN